MLYNYLYLDESGKGADFAAVCGYAIEHEDIQRFSEAWNSCLARLGNLPPVHLREIFHCDEWFRPNKPNLWLQVKTRWSAGWEEKRNQILDTLADVVFDALTKTSLVPVGVVVDAKYLRSGACPKLMAPVSNDAVHFAFRQSVLSYLYKLECTQNDPWVGVVVDDDKDSSFDFHQWIDGLKHSTLDRRGRAIKSLCFVDDKSFPLIQAADMLAYAARQRQLTIPRGFVPLSVYRKLTHNWAEPTWLDSERLDKLEAETT